MGQITDCLAKYRKNSDTNQERLYTLTYDTLRRIAARRIRHGADFTPTELVHEAWLRLSKSKPDLWIDSKHFYNAAASAIRCALIDCIRNQNRLKRGVDFCRADWSESLLRVEPLGAEVESLHEALAAFENVEPGKAEIVRLKFFAGMTIKEIAEVTNLSTATVERYWAYSRAWLYRKMNS